MNYLLVLPVACYPISPTRFAVEGAFAEHLQTLLEQISPEFDRLVVAGPRMSEERYQQQGSYLAELDAERDHVRFEALYPADISTPKFVASALFPATRKLAQLVAEADLVHAGPTHNLWRPIEFPALMMAAAKNKTTVSVTDMDLRNDPDMRYKTGDWSLKSYLLCKYLYDPIRGAQHRMIVRCCSLVLFKGGKLVEDYGRGREHVHEIQDTAYSKDHIISPEQLKAKAERLLDPQAPIRCVFFGRLTGYKGIDHSIRSVVAAKNQGANISLSIIGTGDQEEQLRELVQSLDAQQTVNFVGPLAFGEPLFGALREHDLLLAAPLSVDTPRSAWDAIAMGMGIVAYDTEYYEDVKRMTGAVETVPWLDIDQFTQRLVELDANRKGLGELLRHSAEPAIENSQESWLQRRAAWTRAAVAGNSKRPQAS